MNLHVDLERVGLAHKSVRAELLAQRTSAGHWVGQLPGSPTATAVAVSALVIAHRRDSGDVLRDLAAGGMQLSSEQLVQGDLSELLVESLHWLARHQNEDGGWGDATGARSNLAATMLVRAAFRLTGVPAKYEHLTERAEQYIAAHGGAAGLRSACKDKFIAAPVLANCALAGLVPWRQVPPLPFEVACVPQGWEQRLHVPVVPCALPLLVAVGQAKYRHDPPRNPVMRLVRYAAQARSLAVVQRMQPKHGGFMESTPWTAFVVMGLASIGHQNHRVVERGVEFLLSSVRSDASWPITTNLATWNTTLAVNSLAAEPRTGKGFESRTANGQADRELFDRRCLDWLLTCQRSSRHSRPNVQSGGWGWTDLPGAVPDADDTAGALLALAHWRRRDIESRVGPIDQRAYEGVQWLLDAQQADGGWAMFRGGGGSAFLGRSACDVTAHAMRALAVWQRWWKTHSSDHVAGLALTATNQRITAALERAFTFLRDEQREDGSFSAVRFGNVHHADEQNPVYGTSRVLLMCAELDRLDPEITRRAADWLLRAQHAAGGWGPPRTPLDYSAAHRKNGSNSRRTNHTLEKCCSVEETALAVEALLPLVADGEGYARAVQNGLNWLVDAVEQDRHHQPAAIGVHVARLWYHEPLYPLAFAAGALTRAVRQLAPQRPIVAPVR